MADSARFQLEHRSSSVIILIITLPGHFHGTKWQVRERCEGEWRMLRDIKKNAKKERKARIPSEGHKV